MSVAWIHSSITFHLYAFLSPVYEEALSSEDACISMLVGNKSVCRSYSYQPQRILSVQFGWCITIINHPSTLQLYNLTLQVPFICILIVTSFFLDPFFPECYLPRYWKCLHWKISPLFFSAAIWVSAGFHPGWFCPSLLYSHHKAILYALYTLSWSWFQRQVISTDQWGTLLYIKQQLFHNRAAIKRVITISVVKPQCVRGL